jgi:hypothetical protein
MRYPKARFEAKIPEWSNPHIGPDEILYKDSKSKTEIVFQKTSKKVSSIRWENSVTESSRKPSSKFEF